MNPMRNFAAAFGVVCGVLFVYGFLVEDRVRISVQKTTRATDLHVIVTVPTVTHQMHTVRLEACAAEIQEDATMVCSAEGWWMGSSHPMREDQRQYPFPLRGVPRGWLILAAAVLDGDGRTMAAGETRIIR